MESVGDGLQACKLLLFLLEMIVFSGAVATALIKFLNCYNLYLFINYLSGSIFEQLGLKIMYLLLLDR